MIICKWHDGCGLNRCWTRPGKYGILCSFRTHPERTNISNRKCYRNTSPNSRAAIRWIRVGDFHLFWNYYIWYSGSIPNWFFIPSPVTIIEAHCLVLMYHLAIKMMWTIILAMHTGWVNYFNHPYFWNCYGYNVSVCRFFGPVWPRPSIHEI